MMLRNKDHFSNCGTKIPALYQKNSRKHRYMKIQKGIMILKVCLTYKKMAAMGLVLGSCLLTGCAKFFPAEKQEISAQPTSDTREIFAMDTVMTVTAYGDCAEEALQAAEEEIKRLDALFSVGNDSSDIARLNENASAVVSGETSELINRSKELYQSTCGALNIAVYPLMEAWGFTSGEYRVPDQKEIDAMLTCMDVDKIYCNEDTGEVTLPEGMGIDLGAIAKGYTSARLMEIFASHDVTSAIVTLGGNVQALGNKPDGTKWRVAVENPFSEEGDSYAGILEIKDQAVITSGDYERYFEQEGKRYHHIIDPTTGYSAESGLASVTVVCQDGTLADALSTALFVMGKDRALSYWRKHADEFEMILIEDNKDMTITEGLQDCFSSQKTFSVEKKDQ